MVSNADGGPAPAYRMPVEFGPAFGPRNVPGNVAFPPGPERRVSVGFTVPVPAADLEPLLPSGLRLGAEALTVTVQTLSNLRWLAGRGYSIVSVTVPVRWTSRTGVERAGDFLAVLWESLAEPVITGREELGFPKLFADIDAAPYTAGGAVTAQASWDGTTFFTAGTGELALEDPPDGPPRTVVTHRYLPGLGSSPAAVDELTVTDPELRLDARVVEAAAGTGAFEFRPVTWEQLPTQYLVVNALAGVAPSGPATVRVICVEGQLSAVRCVPLSDT